MDSGLNTLFEIVCQRGITFLNEAAMSDSVLENVIDPYFAKNLPRVRIGYAKLYNTLEEYKNNLDKYKTYRTFSQPVSKLFLMDPTKG